MAGLVSAIYDFHSRNKDMDGRDKPGHDGSLSPGPGAGSARDGGRAANTGASKFTLY